MTQRHTTIVAAYLLLQKENQGILMLRRANSGYGDGMWSLPAGHVEEGEPVLTTMIREAREEIGLVLEASDLRLVHVRDRRAADGHRLDCYFACDAWQGHPVIMEPNKASELRWIADIEHEPDVIENVKQAVVHALNGVNYSQENWS